MTWEEAEMPHRFAIRRITWLRTMDADGECRLAGDSEGPGCARRELNGDDVDHDPPRLDGRKVVVRDVAERVQLCASCGGEQRPAAARAVKLEIVVVALRSDELED